MKIKIAAFALMMIYLSTCTTGFSGGTEGTVTIDYTQTHQEIDGFGGSNAWTSLPRDRETAEELVKLLYSRTDGMGFTILRNRIPFRERLPGDNTPSHNDGFLVRNSDHTYSHTVNTNGTKTFNLNWNAWDLSGTRELIRRIRELGNDGPEELVIMSTPWTTPNNRVTRWKEDVAGVSARLNYTIDWTRPDVWGRLKRAHYNDYADLLADYVLNFESQMGAPLAILSVQNEPNWKVEYESTYWNGIDLRDFIKVIAQRFPMKGIRFGEGGIGIMMPEFENFNINFDEMIRPSLQDPVSNRVISHIGLHQYNGAYDSSTRAGAREFPEIVESGKRFWQTEVSGSGPNIPAGTGINNALYYARMIHWDMVLSQTNAFLFWWLWTNNPNDTTGSLVINDSDDLITTHRLYAMGQYSRFIRPGWRRIECESGPHYGVFTSAYRSMQTNEIAIVLVNDKTTPSTVTINLNNAQFESLNNWRTSANERLRNTGTLRTQGNTTTVTLPPHSITTLYGRVNG